MAGLSVSRLRPSPSTPLTTPEDFNRPRGALLGIMNAVLPLGAVFGAVPAAWVSDRYGRRCALVVGDVIMLAATALQTASLNGQYPLRLQFHGAGLLLNLERSCDVHGFPLPDRLWPHNRIDGGADDGCGTGTSIQPHDIHGNVQHIVVFWGNFFNTSNP